MISTSLQEELVSLRQQLDKLSAAQNFQELLVLIHSSEKFVRNIDVSLMNEDERRAFISFASTHHQVLMLVSSHREEVLNELKKHNSSKKKIKQYKGVKNSAG